MIAALLFLAGLISVLVTVLVFATTAMPLYQSVSASLGAPDPNYVDILVSTGNALSWAVWPFVGGLALMGLARVLMLLGSIDRSLRGNA